MDPMAMFDMERRTGISHDEVDDFAKRMDLISEAMEQIKEGTFDPINCKIPGYKTPEQEEAERVERVKKEQEHKRKEEERLQQLKQEEHENWWRKAKLRFSVDETDDDETSGAGSGQQTPDASATQWASRVLAAYKARDANDYSMWESWVPEDPASLEEQHAREAALEKLRNAEFEKNNPEFCQQFKDDLEKRQQTQRERERAADKLKQLGNRYYKRREYSAAIDKYMQALDKSPFNVAVLTNLAQCHLRLDALDDSVEFSSRALFVNADHVKALSRRAAVWHRQHKWKEAAEDMERALRLDPANPDVVEQHSIIVGDYEDERTQRALEAQLAATQSTGSSSSNSTGRTEELRFLVELLRKINEQESKSSSDVTHAESDEGQEAHVHEAWMAYELVVSFLERNTDARALMRTSGELDKLATRLQRVLTALPVLLSRWSSEKRAEQASDLIAQVEEMTVGAMLQCLAAAMTESPRNQVVLFRNASLREQLLALVGGSTLASLPVALQGNVLHVWEEAIDAKSWKKALTASVDAVPTLLAQLTACTHQVSDMTNVALAISGILFTISGDEHGLRVLAAHGAASLSAIATTLTAFRARSPRVQSNLLGLLTNLSTHTLVRASLEREGSSETAGVRSTLVSALLAIAGDVTTTASAPAAVHITSSERALAALLNLSFPLESLVRVALLDCGAVTRVQCILRYVTASNLASVLLIACRAVSLLCRVHALPSASAARMNALKRELSATTLLDALYHLCQLSLSAPGAATSTNADLWQAHAQIWCHVGWCMTAPESMRVVHTYLQEKRAAPAMLETVAMLNAQHCYRRGSADAPTAPERVVGNVVKVLIAMLADATESLTLWTRKSNLKVLVDALQALPDGLARKNVAILLAKLCQVDAAIKERVRELRGIEIMLSVSKALQSQDKDSAKQQRSDLDAVKAPAF